MVLKRERALPKETYKEQMERRGKEKNKVKATMAVVESERLSVF